MLIRRGQRFYLRSRFEEFLVTQNEPLNLAAYLNSYRFGKIFGLPQNNFYRSFSEFGNHERTRFSGCNSLIAILLFGLIAV